MKVAGTVVAVLATFGVAFAGWGYVKEEFALYRVERLIRSSQQARRTTVGRLYGSPYSVYQPAASIPEDLSKAQLSLLASPRSDNTELLQSYLDIGTENWKKASETLERLAAARPDAPRILNDLGTVLLQQGEEDPINYFRALRAFDRVNKTAPSAPEAWFNRILILRKLQFSNIGQEEISKYVAKERDGPWNAELLRPNNLTEDQLSTQLESALSKHDSAAAEALFLRAPEISRTIAMQYALNPQETRENAEVAEFIGEMLRRRYGDNTVLAMTAPLRGPHRDDVIQARKLVADGANYYSRGENENSLKAYDQALEHTLKSQSEIDRVWVALNRVDTEIRILRFVEARAELDRLVTAAREKNLRWILASALTTYGSNSRLNTGFIDMMNRLEEAVRIFNSIDATNFAVRAQYYLAGHKNGAGDLDGALRLAVDCLRKTSPDDHLRLVSASWLVSVILYKRGFTEEAVLAGRESLSQAQQSQNPLAVIQASSSLALLSEFNLQPDLADNYLQQTERTVRQLSTAGEITRSKISVNVLTARILINRGKFDEAEALLLKNVEAFSTKQLNFAYFESETWMLLGRSYSKLGRLSEAQLAFKRAVDLAEQDGVSLQIGRFRQTYDDTRREVYDSAIDFEFVHNTPDEAWTYMQKYRAKLFLEFLAQFNSSVGKIHTIAIDRSQLQTQLPSKVQVVEYTLLPKRLLIWVVTGSQFHTRSIPIDGPTLEEKVRDFLGKLRAESPITKDSEELFKFLIEPIESLLNRDLPLAIIPDRALHGLPFGALKRPQGGYLISDYRFIVSPTLTHLLAVNAGSPKRDTMTAFGPSVNATPYLPEIKAVKNFYRKFSSFTGPEVTKAAFLNEMEHASVFHYAGHSARDAVDPLRSSILLDGEDYGPNTVTAVDIATHRLQQNAVVVLSSCDSSVGNSKDGIGMRGLTSAFLIGGAGSVVGSLWPVESNSTSDLMIRFHRAFAEEGLSVAESLQKAQRSFIETFPSRTHPYYWSGFVVTGNLSALR